MQGQAYSHIITQRKKSLNGMHEDGFAQQEEQLFGYFPAHSRACASRHNEGKFLRRKRKARGTHLITGSAWHRRS